jgi:hypothetical protein
MAGTLRSCNPCTVLQDIVIRTNLPQSAQKINTRMDKEVGNWFVGYGWVGDVGISPLTTFWPGNYVYVAQRRPLLQQYNPQADIRSR